MTALLDRLHASFRLCRGLELASARTLISTSRRIWRRRDQESTRDCWREVTGRTDKKSRPLRLICLTRLRTAGGRGLQCRRLLVVQLRQQSMALSSFLAALYGQRALRSAYVFDGVRWQERSDLTLPEARTNAVAASDGKSLFLIGGIAQPDRYSLRTQFRVDD